MSTVSSQPGVEPGREDVNVPRDSEQGAALDERSDQMVVQRYQEIAPRLSLEQYRRAATEAFRRLAADERAQFARALQEQAGQQSVPLPPLPPAADEDPEALAQLAAEVQQQAPELLVGLLEDGGAAGGTLPWEALDEATRTAFSRQFGERAPEEWARQSSQARARAVVPPARAVLSAIADAALQSSPPEAPVEASKQKG
jgi:hypothetical protein